MSTSRNNTDMLPVFDLDSPVCVDISTALIESEIPVDIILVSPEVYKEIFYAFLHALAGERTIPIEVLREMPERLTLNDIPIKSAIGVERFELI